MWKGWRWVVLAAGTSGDHVVETDYVIEPERCSLTTNIRRDVTHVLKPLLIPRINLIHFSL
jgi:hypothetical protein